MIYVDCKCGQELKTADHAAGTLRKCPACGEKIEFPTLESARKTAVSATTAVALPPQAFVRGSTEQPPAVEQANNVASPAAADHALHSDAVPEKGDHHSVHVRPIDTAKCHFSVSQGGFGPSSYPNVSMQCGGIQVSDAIQRRIALIFDEEQLNIRVCRQAHGQEALLGPNDVEVSCVVTDFNLGSRAMRYLSPTAATISGAGACRLGIKGYIRDARFGRQEFEINKKSGIGLLGGNSECMMKQNIERAADAIACKLARQRTGTWLLKHNVYTVARSSIVIGLFSPILFLFPPIALVGLILGIWSMTVIALRKLPKQKYIAAAGILLNLIGLGISAVFFMYISKH